jgi:hypothetical protein
MNALKHHSGIPTFLGLTALVAVYIVISPGFANDWALDPLTGLVAIIAALLACSQMAQVSSNRWTGRLWAGVVAVLALVCCANFFESLSDRLGEYFGSDDLDDYLLLLAGPCLILLANIGSTRPRAMQLACAGLLVQVVAAAFDWLAGVIGLVEPPAVWPLLTDSSELLAASLYLLAVFHIAFDATRALSPSGKTAQPLPRRGISIRDRLYPPPFVLGWNLPPADTPAGRVHRLCNQALWPVGDVTISALNLILIALWPCVAAVRACEQVRLNGDAVTRVTGKSSARQFLEQWKLAVSLRISPRYYYIYGFYRPRQLMRAAEYLMRYETKEIAYRCLYPTKADRGLPAPLKDKAKFARRCREHHLRHVPTLFVFKDGIPFDAELPAFDLFLKPVTAKGGDGAERWRLVAPGRYDNGRARELTTNELLMHFRDLSRFVEPYIVQPVLHDHRMLADITPGALCTARMLTCRNENGGYELTDAAFRMPVDARSEVDNFHAGGIASAVDLRTGTLGPATALRTMGGTVWHERHPVTGAIIAGRRLPMWQDAVSLVERAHAAFADYTLVGWDVAFLDDGPILIEGNRGPDIDIHQRTSRTPMGNRRFGALLAHSLERNFKQRGVL